MFLKNLIKKLSAPSQSGPTLSYKGMYAKWPYPDPIDNIDSFLNEGQFLFCDPNQDRDIFWPEKTAKPNPSILIAGCGTMEAPLVAKSNPHATIIGIDQCAESLKHADKLRKKHGLKNLELLQMDLRNVSEFGRKFDLIISTGVLHHLPEPEEGLKALASTLDENGVILLSLYAKYPRAGVYMLQDAFRLLGVRYEDKDVAFARKVISGVLLHHPLGYYVSQSDLSEAKDTDIVDMFLNTKDRAYSVPEILALSDACDLTFQGWFDNLYYYSDGVATLSEDLQKKFSRIPEHEQWAAVELLIPLRGNHRFLLRKNNGEKTFRINFSEPHFLTMIPSHRRHLEIFNLGNDSIKLSREWHELILTGSEAKWFLAINGKLTIAEIIYPCSERISSQSEKAKGFFEKMWKLGHLTVRRS